MKRLRGSPPSAYTIASPIGCPQSNTDGVSLPAGHVGASGPSPSTWRSLNSTRSPWGPNVNGPGSATSNRHESVCVCGSIAHARPSATNATVCVGRGLPVQDVGSAEPSARVAPAGDGDVVDGGAVPCDDTDTVTVSVVHAALAIRIEMTSAVR